MKKLWFTRKNNQRHWVGDGFPVRSIFTYNDIAPDISPFLLLDYAGPTVFEPTTKQRGVGEHPHRGFETVSIVYSGEVEHRDSSGGGGTIRPGDVQWMTAASGMVHEEFHGRDYAAQGGHFEMIQLWVNLPKKFKMVSPRYQSILKESIPKVSIPHGAGTLRVIAGNYLGHSGPAQTYSPIDLWDIRLNAGVETDFTYTEGYTTSIFVLSGEVRLQDGELISEAELAVLEPGGDRFTLKATQDAKILFLGGEPFHEPIVGYGPFVMNTPEEIHQAFRDFQSGKMGSFQ